MRGVYPLPSMHHCVSVLICAAECDGLSHGWNDSFWEGVGLGDLVSDGYRRIGMDVLAPGKSVGKGLTQQSANDMGLCPGIAVATSLIDAHAGGLGMYVHVFVYIVYV